MAGSDSLARRPSVPVRGLARKYALAMTPAEAMEQLRYVGVPVVEAADARRWRFGGRFMVLDPDGFTLYAPSGPTTSAHGLAEPVVGPAIRGRVEPCDRGCRLVVTATPHSVVPARRGAATAWLVGLTAVATVTTVLSGFSAVAAAVSFGILALVLYGALAFDRDRRRGELHDLLALVEGRFAPLEVEDRSVAPLRRRG